MESPRSSSRSSSSSRSVATGRAGTAFLGMERVVSPLFLFLFFFVFMDSMVGGSSSSDMFAEGRRVYSCMSGRGRRRLSPGDGRQNIAKGHKKAKGLNPKLPQQNAWAPHQR